MGFRRIYYDNYSNTIHLWETVDGKTKTIKTKPDIEYYVPDTTGESDKKDIWGNPVRLQVSKTRKAMKDFLSMSNTKSCEASLGEDLKFLQKRYGNKKLSVTIDDFQIATLDIELKSGKTFPSNIAEIVPYEINCISVYYSKTGEMITYGTKEYTGNSENVKEYHYIPDEKRMLEKFILDFRKRRVDIVTGWNIKLFDMPYIINRCYKHEIEISMSPINEYKPRTIKDKFGNSKNVYDICGISILDGVESYRKFTYKKRVNYKLGTIATIETGEGKLDLGGQINHVYKTNWNRYVEYNVQDVDSTKNIEDKKKFIPLIINFCYQALIPFDRIYSTIALVTGYFVRYLHRKNIMFPDPLGTHKELYPGAYVYAMPGLFEYLMSFDVESEYPMIIMQYNISPETLVFNPSDITGLIKTPASIFYECDTPNGHFEVSGIYYRQDKKGILPEIVEEIFNKRKYNKQKSKVAYGMENSNTVDEISENISLPLDFVQSMMNEIKEEGFSSAYYDSQQLVMKILINSMYGVLGNPHFAFYNIHNAMAITIGGRHLIKFFLT